MHAAPSPNPTGSESPFTLPTVNARPKIGLPPSAWAPNPLDQTETTASAVVAVEAPKTPWNASFLVALLVLIAGVNFLLSAFFNGLPGSAESEPTPRLTVTRAADELPLSPTGTGVYRHAPVGSGVTYTSPRVEGAAETMPGGYTVSNGAY